MRKVIFLLVLLALSTTIVSAQQFDLVLEGGRVMDPETGLDAVRNVGIRDGKRIFVEHIGPASQGLLCRLDGQQQSSVLVC
jgi:predicted amidohydrolase